MRHVTVKKGYVYSVRIGRNEYEYFNSTVGNSNDGYNLSK